MCRSNRQSARGFTLVEILMVVAILGIASAVIIPQISSRDDLKAAAGARQVVADLIYAQNRAIAMQTMHYVKFVDNTYTIYARQADGTFAAVTHPIYKGPYTVQLGPGGMGGMQDVTIPTVSLGGNPTLAFDPLGTPYVCDTAFANKQPLTAGSISVQCGADCTLTISIEPYTGELTVQ